MPRGPMAEKCLKVSSSSKRAKGEGQKGAFAQVGSVHSFPVSIRSDMMSVKLSLSAFGSDLYYTIHATSLTTPAFP